MPDAASIVLIGVLGAIAGSFLNALLYRYNTGRSVLHGRSACMHCGETLGGIDLVPILSYVFLCGRCRHCKSKISLQYLAVEAAAALLAIAIYMLHQDPWLFGVDFLAWMTLLFIAVYDLRHQTIPWSASGALVFFAVLHILLLTPSLSSFAAGATLAAPLFLISLLSGGRAMGWGDSALQLGIGLLLGLSAGFTALLLAFWSGAIVGITLSALSKRYTMKSEVPFAPFLVFGAVCAYFFNANILQALAVVPF